MWETIKKRKKKKKDTRSTVSVCLGCYNGLQARQTKLVSSSRIEGSISTALSQIKEESRTRLVKVRTNSWVTFGFLQIDIPVLADHRKLISISSVRTLDAVERNCQEWWPIRTEGEKESHRIPWLDNNAIWYESIANCCYSRSIGSQKETDCLWCQELKHQLHKNQGYYLHNNSYTLVYLQGNLLSFCGLLAF